MTAVNFEVTLERAHDTVTLRLRGDFDIAGVPRVAEARDQALADAPSSLVVDLTAVDFIDSSGLKFLLDTERRVRETPCRLSIRPPRGPAMTVFTVTGADRLLPFAQD
jgi:anti-sigma B factor antagonist